MPAFFVGANIGSTLSLVIMALLALLIFNKAKSNAANMLFGFFVLSAFLWVFANLMANLSLIYWPSQLLLWTRLSLVGPIFVPFFITLFTKTFPDSKLKLNRLVLGLVAIVTLWPLLFVLTKYNVSSVEIVDSQKFESTFEPGLLYLYVVCLVLIGFLVAAYQLIKKRKKSENIVRRQIDLILTGLALTVVGGVTLSGILPIFGYTALINISPVSVIFFILFTSYAIVRHRLFNVKVIATEIVVIVLNLVMLVQTLSSTSLNETIANVVMLALLAIFGILLIKSVIVEIRRREQIQALSSELASANKKLKSLDGLKTEFLSIATHQLRTPLTGIKGYVSMMADGDFGEIKPEQKKILDSVLENTEKLVKLIADFLDISRIERGKLEINKQPTDVMHMMQSIYDIFKPAAAAKNLQLMYHPPTNPVPATQLDEEKFRQVILNIVDNAIKYTPNGRIDLYFTDEGDHFRFESRDTGVGMTQEDISRLFQRFSRAKDAFKTSTTGTGLGMYVAKKVVESHAGKIWAESRGKDQGSSWFVEIPYDQSRSVTASLSPEEKDAQEASKATEKIEERLKDIQSK